MKRLLFLLMMSVIGSLQAQQRFEGLVEPERDVLIAPSVNGRVAKVHAGEGTPVREGEAILSLDDRIEALEVKRRTLVLEDKAELEAAAHRRDLLREDLESTRRLFETTASVSRDELTRKEVETLLSEVEVGRLEQAERREQAELDIAKERMSQYHILSPFDGIIAEMTVDEGESVQSGQPVLRLVDTSAAYLVLNLPADVASDLQLDQPVTLQFRQEPPKQIRGKVAFVAPVIDPASGLRKVKFWFSNQDLKIEPGRSGFWVRGDRTGE